MPLHRTFGLLTVPLALNLAACATPTAPPSKAVSELLKPVPVYDKAPCWMQKEWSADNSRKATAETGKVTAYKPPCVYDPKPKLESSTEPKTS